VEVVVRNPGACSAAVVHATLDGAETTVSDGAAHVPLPDTAGTHRLEVLLGASR
jgi:hypothetical protein